MPERYQHRRGVRLPDGVRLVSRSSRWGNPYKLGVHGDRDECIAQYRLWLAERLATEPTFLAPLREARGLACYCALYEACHADVLIEAITAAGRPPARS